MAKRTTKKSSRRSTARRRRTPSRVDAPPQKARLTRLATAVREADADAALISSPHDVAYLTGFFGGDSMLIVPARGKPVCVSDRRYEEDLEPFRPLVSVVMRSGAMHGALAQQITDRKLARVLCQPEHLTMQAHAALAKLVGRRTLVPRSGLVTDLRLVKDDTEIRAIRRAIRVQQDALLATLPRLKAGQTELEICAILEHEMKARGASGPAFDTIVAAKANGSRPHYQPSTTRTARNRPLLIDWGAVVGGYRGDMTRVFCFGRWPRVMREIYEIVLDAHELAAAAIEPGMTGAQIDAVARDHITKHGYGEQFGHSLGHGIGIQTHEGPSLSKLAGDKPLEPGHVVTIEPGIYLPGVGGVRIEDDYAVTPTGAKNLCSLPRDIEFATLD